MGMWIIIRDFEQVQLVYRNLIQDREYDLGSMSSIWSDDSVVQWIFDNSQQLTSGDFIKLSDGRMLHWDGRAFDPERWSRMNQERASA